MLAFFFRFAGCMVLAVGTVFAIGDIARTLSGNRLRLTTLEEAWALLGGAPFSNLDGAGATLVELFASWPAAAALAALAVLLILAGRRRTPRRAY